MMPRFYFWTRCINVRRLTVDEQWLEFWGRRGGSGRLGWAEEWRPPGEGSAWNDVLMNFDRYFFEKKIWGQFALASPLQILGDSSSLRLRPCWWVDLFAMVLMWLFQGGESRGVWRHDDVAGERGGGSAQTMLECSWEAQSATHWGVALYVATGWCLAASCAFCSGPGCFSSSSAWYCSSPANTKDGTTITHCSLSVLISHIVATGD